MSELDVNKIRNDFPYLENKLNGKPNIYFDNGSTTQKPNVVMDTIVKFYSNYNSNINRSLHSLGSTATKLYEQARLKVAKFINAKSMKEIIFVKNCTDGINLIFNTILNCEDDSLSVSNGDEILITELEHHSNLIPWQQFCMKKGLILKYVEIDEFGQLDMEDFQNKLTDKTKLVCCTHVSNSLGTLVDIKKICRLAHLKNAMVIVDGTQSTPHMKVDMKDLDCDFFVFSAHKMLGPMGLGVVYGKLKILEKLPPYNFGGGMIKEVERFKTIFEDLPYKYEAGTPNVCGAVAFAGSLDNSNNEKIIGAIDYLNEIGMENIEKYEKKLTKYAFEKLNSIENVKILGTKNLSKRSAIISFNVFKNGELIDPYEIASLLNEFNISVRAGKHCSYISFEKLKSHLGSVRISFYIYNTIEEIDYFVECLKEIIENQIL